MKNSSPINFYVAAVSVLLLFLNLHAEDEAVLSVSQTIDLVLNRPIDGDGKDWMKLVARANPVAKVNLEVMLRDASQEKRWDVILYLLSFIGDSNDVEVISNFIDSRQGNLIENPSPVYSALIAFGNMTRRNVPGAKRKLDLMIDPAYWRMRRFRLHGDVPTIPRFEYEMVLNVLRGRAHALEPNFYDIMNQALEYVKEPDQKKLMNDWFGNIKTAYEEYKNSKTDIYKPEKPMSILTAASVYRTSDLASGIIESALKEYATISKQYLKNDIAVQSKTLASKGIPVSEQIVLKENLKHMGENIKNLLTDIKNQKLELGSATITINESTTIAQTAKGSSYFDAKTLTSTTIVKAAYLNSQALVEKYFPQAKENSVSVNENGELVVYMIKVDGEWRWNPFGW